MKDQPFPAAQAALLDLQGAIDGYCHRREQLEREIVAILPSSPWSKQVGRLRERTGTGGWLLRGRHAGTHISAETLRGRLKRYGIGRSRKGQHAALRALAARLPASILAERIGIHQARATQWVRLAGASYADHVALRGSAAATKVGTAR